MFEIITSYFPMLTKQVMLSVLFLMAVIVAALALNWQMSRIRNTKVDVDGDDHDAWGQKQLDAPKTPSNRLSNDADEDSELVGFQKVPGPWARLLRTLRSDMMKFANEQAQRNKDTSSTVRVLINMANGVLAEYHRNHKRDGIGPFEMFVFSIFAEVVSTRVGKGNEVSYAKFYLEFYEQHTRLTGLMALAYRHKGQVSYVDRIEHLLRAVGNYFDWDIMHTDGIDMKVQQAEFDSDSVARISDIVFKDHFYRMVVDNDFMPTMKRVADKEQAARSRLRSLSTRHNREQRSKRLRREAQYRKTA